MSTAIMEAATAASSFIPEENGEAPVAMEQTTPSSITSELTIGTASESQETAEIAVIPVTADTQESPKEDSEGSVQVKIPDYMTAELSAVEQAEPIQTEAGKAESPALVIEPTVVTLPQHYQITVQGVTYVATNDGFLYTQTTRGDKTSESLVSSLIVIVAVARDSESRGWGKVVRFEDQDGVQKQVYIPNRDIMTDGRAVVRSLVDEGLVISTQKGMVDDLVHYLNFAPPIEKAKANCTDSIGWHENVYLFPDNSVIGHSDTKYVYTGASISSNHSVKGTWQDWKQQVGSLCRGNSLLTLAVCVSFASALLRLLKIESGGYHLYGESSSGKSTSLYVAASVHGEPEHLMGSWRTTSNGVEGKAKKCNDSLMILDELHQSNPKEAGEAAYMIMNGKGKQRANVLGDARSVTEWRVNCLSSGEIACAAFIQEGGKNSRAGQEVRMLDISADMGVGLGAFENIHDAEDANAFAEQLKKASSENYGAPIREFIQQLTIRLDRLEENFTNTKESFFEDFVPEGSGPQVRRVANKMAAVAMAGEFATHIGLTGWDSDEAYTSIGGMFTRWLSTRGTTGQHEAEKAVEQVKNFLLRHGTSRFIPISLVGGSYKLDSPERQYSNMAGYRLTNDQRAYEFLVNPEPYASEMCQGLTPKSVTKTLVDRGFLMKDSDGKPQVRRRLPGIDQARVYHFTAAILSDTDEFVPAEPETTPEPEAELQAYM